MALMLGFASVVVAAVPNQINVQGILTDAAGIPITTPADAIFGIWTQPAGGDMLWSEIQTVTPDLSGRFDVILGTLNPIPDSAFNLDAFLSITIESYPELYPRQQLVSVAYAYKAKSSAEAVVSLRSAPGSVNSEAIIDGTIQLIDIGQNGAGSGQVVKWTGSEWVPADDETSGGSSEGWVDVGPSVHLVESADNVGIGTDTPAYKLHIIGQVVSGENNTASGPFSVIGGGNNNLAGGDHATVAGGGSDTASATYSTVAGGAFNIAAGFASTVNGGHNNEAREGRSTVGGGYHNAALNVESTVGGGQFNTAGGAQSVVAGGESNAASGWRSVVGGGYADSAFSDYSTIGGGWNNSARADWATVSGGGGNHATGIQATVAGGGTNFATDYFTTVSGGSQNSASAFGATVSGGVNNRAYGQYSIIGGGGGLSDADSNSTSGDWSVIGGGSGNLVSSSYAIVGGGLRNHAKGEYVFIGSGQANEAEGNWSAIVGGQRNKTYGYNAFIGGGADNEAHDGETTIGGGSQNVAKSRYSTIGGGSYNKTDAPVGLHALATVGGGHQNDAMHQYATIAGGAYNKVSAHSATIGGGMDNKATDTAAVVSGGCKNYARGIYSVVCGGGSMYNSPDTNAAHGRWSVVAGGRGNVALGDNSFVAGRRAQAWGNGSFVWADDTDADFTASTNEFAIRAGAGVRAEAGNMSYGASFTNEGNGDGVRALASTSAGLSWAALYANNNGTSPAIYGHSTSGPAAYLDGPVTVIGWLTKSGGGFKIDHPLDPAHKYLNHSFVESPDMKNIYDGVVILDAAGEAWVQLPEWFGALNKDFRYQLTAIGAPGPNLYIADEIADNHFRIAGGSAGMKVSWQVTGTRQDAWANAHRLSVEEDKSGEELGLYLHPTEYGLPKSAGIINESAKETTGSNELK